MSEQMNTEVKPRPNKSLLIKLLGIQKKIGAVTKSAKNPHFNSRYADLNEVLDVAKEALNNEGLFLIQEPGADNIGGFVKTVIADADTGEMLSCRVPFSASEDNMQRIGAAITYGRRFGIVSLLALESEDDDGETAVGRGNFGLSKGASAPAKIPKKEEVADTKVSTPAAVVNNAADASQDISAILKQITLTSRVLVDSKRMTQEDVLIMLRSYGVARKEGLSPEQAAKLLKQLKAVLDATANKENNDV